MGYFNLLPRVKYDFTLKTDEKDIQRILPDLTTRVSLFADEQAIDELTDLYRIEDGDTPEIISFKMYGTTDYNWAIMHINGIANIQQEWPLSEEQFISYIQEKYPGVGPSEVSAAFRGYTTVDAGVTYLAVDEVYYPLFDNNTFQVGMFVRDRIPGLNPTQAITFGEFSIKEDTTIIAIDNLNKRLALSQELNYQIGAIDNSIEFLLRDSVPEWQMIKEYRTENNVVCDSNYTAYYTEQGGSPDVWNGGLSPWSIYDYESELNEAKRDIKVVKPSLIVEYVRLYREAMLT